MTVSPSIVPDPNAPLLHLLLRARTQQLTLADLFQTAETLSAAGQTPAAVELYKTWIAFNDANPLLHLAYFNYAVSLSKAGDVAATLHALRAAVRLNPLFGQAHVNLGRTLEDCGLTGQAVQQWRTFADGHRELIEADFVQSPTDPASAARCQAVWSHTACFCGFSLGRLMPTVRAGVGVTGRPRNRSGCCW